MKFICEDGPIQKSNKRTPEQWYLWITYIILVGDTNQYITEMQTTPTIMRHHTRSILTTPSTTKTEKAERGISIKGIKPLIARDWCRPILIIQIITLFAAAIFIIEIHQILVPTTSPPSPFESAGLVVRMLKLKNNKSSSYDSSQLDQNHEEGADQSATPTHH